MRLFNWLPRPFKAIQRYLSIEEEWKQFKRLIWPHKYKVLFIVSVSTYPFYSTYLKSAYVKAIDHFNRYTQLTLTPNTSFALIIENLYSHLLDDVFNDKQIHHETVSFLHRVIKEQQFLNDLLNLLLSCLQSQQFTEGVKSQLKTIIIQIVKDPQVEKQLIITGEKIINSKQVRFALQNLIKQVFSSKQAIQTLIKLLKTSMSDIEVKQSLGDAVNYAVRQVLVDQNTLNQLKIFIIFLLKKFYTDTQMKGLVDVLFQKGLGFGKKKRQDPQLQKILKPNKKVESI